LSERASRIGRLLALLLLVSSSAARAASIVPIGVLGNSGESGPTLLRAQGFDPARAASGVALDSSGTIWVSGGDSIVRLGLDGRLIERSPLVPRGSSVDSTAFVVLGGTLYFIGWLANKVRAVFALPMRSGATAAALPVVLPQPKSAEYPPRLGAQPFRGRLLLAADVKEAPAPTIAIYRLEPLAATLTPEFTVPGERPESLVVDSARQRIYVGGQVVKGADGYRPGVVALQLAGDKVTIEFVAAGIPLPATPSWFNGRVSLAGDALWDVSGPYGFVARMNLQFQGSPGVVARWRHELDQTTQIIDVGSGASAAGGPAPLVVATTVPDACYLAEWDARNSEFRLTRRFGSLPDVRSLGLSAEGWVTVGTAHTQLWWRWDDEAAAPPRMADLSVGATGGFFRGDRFFAFGAIKDLSELARGAALPLVFSPTRSGSNSAFRPTGGQPLGPITRPSGVGVLAPPDKSTGTLYVVDSGTKAIYRLGISLDSFRLDTDRIEALVLAGEALRAPTDVVPLTDGRLFVADEGRVLFLRPRNAGLGVEWAWDNSDGPGGAVGQRLHLAAYGSWLLVSDTDRNRVLWLDWQQRKVLAQFGETDTAGDDPTHLKGPRLVALHTTRAVVADAGNQRVLKLDLRP
jgi:sugar lactone lactonase YvrE